MNIASLEKKKEALSDKNVKYKEEISILKKYLNDAKVSLRKEKQAQLKTNIGRKKEGHQKGGTFFGDLFSNASKACGGRTNPCNEGKIDASTQTVEQQLTRTDVYIQRSEEESKNNLPPPLPKGKLSLSAERKKLNGTLTGKNKGEKDDIAQRILNDFKEKKAELDQKIAKREEEKKKLSVSRI